MDGRIFAFICFSICLATGEYSDRGGGATSFSQFFSRQFEPSDGPQYRPFGSGSSSFPKEIPVPFPVHVEKKVPFPIKVPVAVPVDRPIPVHVPKPYPVPVVSQIPFAVDRPVPYPLKVYQPVHQGISKSPFQQFQPYQHHDGFNQHFNPQLQ